MALSPFSGEIRPTQLCALDISKSFSVGVAEITIKKHMAGERRGVAG
jgi:hypothetical protein